MRTPKLTGELFSGKNVRILQHRWDTAFCAIAVVLVLALWYLGFKEISILTLILGFFIWIIEKRIDQQNQIIIQASQAGFDFKQRVTQDMYEAVKDVWTQGIWLALDSYADGPLTEKDHKRREEYRANLQQFQLTIAKHSVILRRDIFKSVQQLELAILTYNEVNDVEMRATGSGEQTASREADNEKTQSAKDLIRAITDLSRIIRVAFDLEKLPGAIIQSGVPLPSDEKS